MRHKLDELVDALCVLNGTAERSDTTTVKQCTFVLNKRYTVPGLQAARLRTNAGSRLLLTQLTRHVGSRKDNEKEAHMYTHLHAKHMDTLGMLP